MKLKVVFVAALIQCAVVLTSVAAPKPFTLDYKGLPFGKPESDVIGWVGNQGSVVVFEDKTVNINSFICYQAIVPYFQAGTRKTDAGLQFYNFFIKKFVVERCADVFPGTFRVELFFVKGDDGKYTLCMAHRICKAEAGVMNEIYEKDMKTCIKDFGEPSKKWITNSTGASATSTDRLLPANVSMWQKDKGSIFFMMADNGMQQFREYLFVNSAGWDTYLKSLEKARAWR